MYSHDLFLQKKPEYLGYLRRKTNHSPLPYRLSGKRAAEKINFMSKKRCKSDGKIDEGFLPHPNEISSDEDSIDERPLYTSIFYKWDYVCGIVQLPTNSGLQQNHSSSPGFPAQMTQSHHEILLTFCRDRNPYQSPHTLISEVRKLLRENADLAENFESYLRALYPPQSKVHSNDVHCVMKIQANEILLMRTFLAYIVAQLHSSLGYYRDRDLDKGLKMTLRSCLDRWQAFVRLYN